MNADIFDEIRERLIESDLTPHDLRIALDILKDVEEQQRTQ